VGRADSYADRPEAIIDELLHDQATDRVADQDRRRGQPVEDPLEVVQDGSEREHPEAVPTFARSSAGAPSWNGHDGALAS
jgi:hypothetical protein